MILSADCYALSNSILEQAVECLLNVDSFGSNHVSRIAKCEADKLRVSFSNYTLCSLQSSLSHWTFYRLQYWKGFSWPLYIGIARAKLHRCGFHGVIRRGKKSDPLIA